MSTPEVPTPLSSVSAALEDTVAMAIRTMDVCLGMAPAHSAAHPAPLRPIGLTTPIDLVPMLVLVAAVGVIGQLLDLLGSILGSACGLESGRGQGAKLERFKDSFTELVYYSFGLFVLFRVCGNTTWLFPSGWAEVMHDGRVQLAAGLSAYAVPAEIKFYYLIEFGWYASGLLKVLCSRKKKDFYEMLAHHLVTCLLLSLSLATGYMRIGIVVLMLHNLFDPLLHLAKCANYIKLPIIPDVSFVLCAITFGASRLYYYPQAIYAAWSGVCSGNAPITCPGGVWDKTPVEFALIFLLTALLPIHALWFFMILKVLKKAVFNSGVQGDIREDTDSEVDLADPDRVGISPASASSRPASPSKDEVKEQKKDR